MSSAPSPATRPTRYVKSRADAAKLRILLIRNQQQAQDRQAEANAKDQASHAGTNIAGMSVSASGVAANDPNRQDGSWNQTIGSAKEAVGGLVGAEGLKKEGQDQHAQGQAQEAQGQVNDFGKGVKDRVSGTVGGMVAGATGDREAQAKAEQQVRTDNHYEAITY